MTISSSGRAATITPRRVRRAGRGRDEILDAAADVIAARGADATRFSDVSDASGVPVGTLQYYFGNRDDLLHAAFQHLADQELRAMEEALRDGEDPWIQLRRLLTAVIPLGERSRAVWRCWVEYWRAGIRDPELREGANEMYRRWRELMEGVLRAGIDRGRFRRDVDPAVAAFQIAALVDGIGVPVVLEDEVLAEGSRTPSEMVVDAAARLLGVTDPPRDGVTDGDRHGT